MTLTDSQLAELNSLGNKVYFYFYDGKGMIHYPQAPEDATHVSNNYLTTVSYEQDLITEANIKVVRDIPNVLVYSKWQQTTAYLPIETESDYQSTLSILQSLETYPCLDDVVWSALEAEVNNLREEKSQMESECQQYEYLKREIYRLESTILELSQQPNE